jgi:hypothetical protein
MHRLEDAGVNTAELNLQPSAGNAECAVDELHAAGYEFARQQLAFWAEGRAIGGPPTAITEHAARAAGPDDCGDRSSKAD